MTDKQPEALIVADALTYEASFDIHHLAIKAMKEGAVLLRTQHAAIERKDALLRQAWETLENHEGNYKLTAAECDVVVAVQDAITKELSQ